MHAGVELTPAEQHYIKTHPTIRVHNESNWAPFNFHEEEKAKGLSIDFMNLIAKKVGLNITYITGYTWNDFLEMMQKDALDVMLNIVKNDEREQYLLFTTPYQSVLYCIVMRRDSKDKIDKFQDILDKNIALEEGFFNHNYLNKNHPNTHLILRKDTLSTLQAVSYGEADLTIGLLPIEAYMIKHYGLNNLKLIGISDEDFFSSKELRIATSIHNPILQSILQKGLDAITEEEKNDIVKHWINVEIEKTIDWALIEKILLFFFLILSGTLFWMWRIKKIQRQLADSNFLMKKLLDSIPNPIFYKDAKGMFIGFNEAYEKAFGIDSHNLLGKTVLDLAYLPIEDRHQYHSEDTKVIAQNLSLQREQELVLSDGLIHHTLYSVNAFQTSNGKPGGLIGIFVDITEQKNIQATLADAMTQLEETQKEVELSHKATKDSIEYASLIQHSLIPSNAIFHNYFKDYCVIWHPKDIVGGDIYFIEEFQDGNELLLMMMDCTGHGVPGAFVTMLVKAIERQIIATIRHKNESISPAKILGLFNRNIKQLLNQHDSKSINNTGFDCAIVLYNKENQTLIFAGAQFPLFYTDDTCLKIIKGDRHSVGYKQSQADFEFTDHVLHVKEDMSFYLTSDGYLDQNGGAKGFPFGKKKFMELIETYHGETFADQQEIFLEELASYQGDEIRNDDVMLIGFRI